MLTTLRSKILALVIGLMSITSALLIYINITNFQRQMAASYHSIAKDTLKSIIQVLETEYHDLLLYEINTIKTQRSLMQDIGTSIVSMIDSFHDLQKTEQITEQMAKEKCLQMLKNFRYKNNHFFFVYDKNLIGLSHPEKKMVGKKWSGYKDLNNVDALRFIQNTITAQKNLFTVFMWPKLENMKPVKQMGFFLYYPKWDWIVGTSMEIDYIKEIAFKKEKNIVFKLNKILDKLSLSDIGSILIFDDQGKIINYTSKLDKNGRFSSEAMLDQAIQNLLIKASKNPNKSIEYQHKNSNGENTIQYIAHVDFYKYTNWYIAASINKDIIKKKRQAIILQQSVILILVLFAGIVVAFFISQKMSNSLSMLTQYARSLSGSDFKQKENNFLALIKAEAKNVEIKQLTQAFIFMESKLGKNLRAMENHQKDLETLVEKRTKELFNSNQNLKLENSERKKAQNEREKSIKELQKALEKVKTLSGLIPICSNCKKIRDNKGSWNNLENYIENHSEAVFSHGICKECTEKLYGDEPWYNKDS